MTSFTQEELARLVQFITGSSQLPPGGFAELSPPIQISSAPTTDALPTAHTWWVKYRIFRVLYFLRTVCGFFSFLHAEMMILARVVRQGLWFIVLIRED